MKGKNIYFTIKIFYFIVATSSSSYSSSFIHRSMYVAATLESKILNEKNLTENFFQNEMSKVNIRNIF